MELSIYLFFCYNSIKPITNTIIMTSKIIIKNTQYADSRTAPEDIDRDKLYEATQNHLHDVERGMDWFSKQIHDAGLKHDFTKMDCFDEVYAPSVLSGKSDDEFKNEEWYKRHISEERHHVNDNAHSDVDMVDIIEHLVDVVMSGLGRAGFVNSKYTDISPELLYRAYWNSVHKLENIVEVSNAEDLEQ